MDSYNLSFTLDPEQGKILSGLARRCRNISGWGPQELLQYAATANSQAEIDLKLDFLQDAVTHLETVNHMQAEKDGVRISVSSPQTNLSHRHNPHKQRHSDLYD